MTIRPEALVASFAAALDRRSAALFVGAGLSIAAGYPGWSALLKEAAAQIGLDVARETDLPAVAQLFVNRSTQSRARINQLLVDNFRGRPKSVPENHRILA